MIRLFWSWWSWNKNHAFCVKINNNNMVNNEKKMSNAHDIYWKRKSNDLDDDDDDTYRNSKSFDHTQKALFFSLSLWLDIWTFIHSFHWCNVFVLCFSVSVVSFMDLDNSIWCAWIFLENHLLFFVFIHSIFLFLMLILFWLWLLSFWFSFKSRNPEKKLWKSKCIVVEMFCVCVKTRIKILKMKMSNLNWLITFG